MASNKKYVDMLKKCREEHLCYGCRNKLPIDYDKARCPKCLESQRVSRAKRDGRTVTPKIIQPIKTVEVQDRGELVKHTVVVDENIEIGIKIPKKLVYGEMITLLDSVSRMMKPFLKQEQMFGRPQSQVLQRNPEKRTFIMLNAEQKIHFVKVWEGTQKRERIDKLVETFPQLSGISYDGLAKRYYNYKKRN